MIHSFHLTPFWDTQYQQLEYRNEPFNDAGAVRDWLSQQYHPRFTGDLCDMRSPQPTWNQRFIDHFTHLGWQDIGTSYYRMGTGTVLPVHQDTYRRYIERFSLEDCKKSIVRAIVFLEKWKSGHYLEVDGSPITGWKAGDCVYWHYDTPHMAANIGLEPRYTLQVTGHIAHENIKQ